MKRRSHLERSPRSPVPSWVGRYGVALLACGAVACGLQTGGLAVGTEDGGAAPGPTSLTDARAGGPSGSPIPGSADASSGTDGHDAGAGGGSGNDVDASAPPRDASVPDVYILDPDGGPGDPSNPCDLDLDGHRALTPECGGDDCCDYDGRAFPGQAGYFEAPSACGTFDFDCDGKSAVQDGVVACKLGFFNCSGDGFKADTACGVNAPYEACNYALVTCSKSESTRTQACR